MIKKLIYKLLFSLLIPLGFLLSSLATKNPHITETLYSTNFFVFTNQIISNVSGIFPFSLGELIICALIIFFTLITTKSVLLLFSNKTNKYTYIANRITSLIFYCSISYFLFITLWGLNYYRLPFSTISHLKIQKSSVAQLYLLCEELVSEANELRNPLDEDKNSIMTIKGGYKNVFKRTSIGYDLASKKYSQLGGNYSSPKKVFFSEFLSYSGISGIYFPFTGEANINTSIPDCLLPSTTCHELAHQRGFAREDEANYISYLVCTFHPDMDFQYSGVQLALVHSLNALYKYDKALYNNILAKCNKNVLNDLKFVNNYWSKYDGPLEKIQSKINNAYLKANRQSDGIYSYGRMVDLLIAEYNNEKQ